METDPDLTPEHPWFHYRLYPMRASDDNYVDKVIPIIGRDYCLRIKLNHKITNLEDARRLLERSYMGIGIGICLIPMRMNLLILDEMR